MTPKEYERAVLERFKIAWPTPFFEVRHNVKLPGAKTKTDRQIDVAIYVRGETTPSLLVEAKRHRRRIHSGIAGSTIALVQDIGLIPTIMVTTSGFSIAATNHLQAEEIGHIIITIREAKGLQWIPELAKRFAIYNEFKQVSGEKVEALRTGDPAPFLDVDIPYEEWLAVIETGLSLFLVQTASILRWMA